MPELKSSNGNTRRAPETPDLVPVPSNGNGSQARPVVHLDEFLAQISARLTAAGSISLSRTLPGLGAPAERMQVIVFKLDSIHYAVEIGHVSEVGRRADITHVPGVSDWVLGVINLHGEIVSVVDLAAFLDLNATARRRGDMMIIAHAKDQKIGLIVDEIEPILTISAEQIISPPFKIDANLVRYLRGAIDRKGHFVRLLDCERLLLGRQMQQFS